MTTSAAWPAGASSAAIPAAAPANPAPASTIAPATTSPAARSPRSSPSRRASPTRCRAPSRPSRMCQRQPLLAVDRALVEPGHHRRLPLRWPVRAVRRPRQSPLLPPRQQRDPRAALQDHLRRGGLDRDADRPDLRGCAPGSTFYVYIERVASRGIVNGYPCGGPFEPCVAPTNRPYFRPFNNATRGQMAKIAAAAFFPGCATPARR